MARGQCWMLQPYGDLDGKFPSIILKDGINYIGRDKSNNIVSSSPWVSEYHCKMVIENGRLSVTDYGSTNGTYINEDRIKPHEDKTLKPNDILSIGKPYFSGDPISDDSVFKILSCIDLKEQAHNDMEPIFHGFSNNDIYAIKQNRLLDKLKALGPKIKKAKKSLIEEKRRSARIKTNIIELQSKINCERQCL